VLNRALDWLEEKGPDTDYWSQGPDLGSDEEVRFIHAGPRRVEYRFSPRASAVSILCESGRPMTAGVVHGVGRMIYGQRHDRWPEIAGADRQRPTASVLYDACAAGGSFKELLVRRGNEAWATRNRVLIHPDNESMLVRVAKRRRNSLIGLLALPVVTILLNVSGVAKGWGVTIVAFIMVTLLIGIITNLLSAYLVEGRRR
jgi:hypothetical protein